MPRCVAVAFVPFVVLAFAAATPVSAQKAGSGSSGGTSHAPAAPSPAPRPASSGTSSGNTSTYPYGYGYGYPYGSTDGVDPERAALYDRLHRQERQKEVVKDTDRLVKLTTEYQNEVKATGQTAETEKHLREIEKLAHNVRTTLMQ